VSQTNWPTLGVWAGGVNGGYGQVAESEIVPARSQWGFPGGNPSGNRGPVLHIAEDIPVWGFRHQAGLVKSPDCSVPSTINGVALPAQVPVNYPGIPHDLAKRLNDMTKVLTGSKMMTSTKCQAFFKCGGASATCNPDRAQYYDKLTTAVTQQIRYDGNLSTITLWDAGVWGSAVAQDPTLSAFFKSWAMACDFAPIAPTETPFQGKQVPLYPTVAETQTQSPATDSYWNDGDLFRSYINPATILHETLHNLTGKSDDELRTLLSIDPSKNPVQSLAGTEDINWALEAAGCAPQR
jgi:hypothetical protein